MSSSFPLLSFETKESKRSKHKAEAKSGPGQLYLRVKIPGSLPSSSRPLLISMACIQEVLSLPVQRLSPMPSMPPSVLGLMNRGNRVFWLVDLALLLGLSRLEPNLQQHNVLILRVGASALGLAVSEVQPMIWVADEQLQSDMTVLNLPQTVPLGQLVSHWVDQDETRFWLLKAHTILQSPVLHQLGFTPT